MRLAELLPELPHAQLLGDAHADVSAVTHDSRKVGPGSIFVAVAGFKADGHDYIRQALAAGATAIVVQADHEAVWRPLLAQSTLPTLVAPDTRAALAAIAASLNGHPARKLRVVGVTGTNGKTSLCHLIAHVLESGGQKTGLISTAECRIGSDHLPDTGRFTTPEAPELQAMLRQIADAGCSWAVVEATSHGLALHRLDHCEFDVAVVTNIGADHLEFHGGVEGYMAAKGLLFRMLDQSLNKGLPKIAVLNRDDSSFAHLRGLTQAGIVSYGLTPQADVYATGVEEEAWSSSFLLHTPQGERQAQLRCPGTFGVYNALAATAVALSAGLGLDAIRRALAEWPGAPGRLELIDEGQRFTVVVDFAHAPDSLRGVLRLLRARSRGRIIAVFGCIGERERDRRSSMGVVAAEAADYTIVTDDDPYSEDRDAIIAEIAGGLLASGKREGHDFALIPDRREAISHALGMAVDEDAVQLAGKGHEREVHLADSSYECDDREVARRVLRELARGH